MLVKNATILAQNNTVLTNTDIHIQDGIIDYIGTDYPHPDSEVYNGNDKLVVPGFYNTHCHVPMTLLRNSGGNLPLSQWLNERIFPLESQLTDDAVYYGSLLGIAEMLQSGVVSFNDMYYYSDRICEAVLESGILANIAMDGFAFKDEIDSKFTIDKHRLKDFYHQYHQGSQGQIQIDMCIHAQYTTSPRKAKELSEIAKSLKCNIQLHLSETEQENLSCYRDFRCTPTEFFHQLGVFESPSTAAHCVHLTNGDLEILKNEKVTVAHCPVSNLKLGSGIANLKKMMAKGINITLGTDGAASNDNLDYLSDLKTAALLQKGISKNATFLSSEEMLKIATINGARAQKRTKRGAIAIGNYADFFVLDLNAINLLPKGNPYDALLFSALSKNIVLTVVNGKVLYKNGVFTTIDMEKVKYHIKQLNFNL